MIQNNRTINNQQHQQRQQRQEQLQLVDSVSLNTLCSIYEQSNSIQSSTASQFHHFSRDAKNFQQNFQIFMEMYEELQQENTALKSQANDLDELKSMIKIII